MTSDPQGRLGSPGSYRTAWTTWIVVGLLFTIGLEVGIVAGLLIG